MPETVPRNRAERRHPERLAYTPAEAAELIGVSRPHIYKLMNEGLLPSFSVGRARRIWHDDLIALGRPA